MLYIVLMFSYLMILLIMIVMYIPKFHCGRFQLLFIIILSIGLYIVTLGITLLFIIIFT